MDFTSFQITSSNSASLNTGSYLNSVERTLFFTGTGTTLWFGLSANDVIELSVYDRDENFIGWNALDKEKTFQLHNSTYLNTLNFPVTYSYSDLVNNFILWNTSASLINPTDEVSSSFGISTGSYFLVYNFTREMAGNSDFPLVIKEISPSRKEIKLVPVTSSSLSYQAFCEKKIILRDVASIYISQTKEIPVSQIYATLKYKFPQEINTLQTIFFLSSDGATVDFIRNLYEDFVLYTSTPRTSNGIAIGAPDRLIRIQGIKTYFLNYLLSSLDTISDFSTIDATFNGFVSASIERKFLPIGPNPAEQYVKAKVFLYDFFTKYYYQPISDLLAKTYSDQYYSFFKNALNLGNNRLLLILDHGMLDERNLDSDPLTLLVKLQTELPNDIMAHTQCWVSNVSLTPYIINAILNFGGGNIVHQIGPPDFSIPIPHASLTNANILYASSDLQQSDQVEREIAISKNLTALNTDYTDFKNFIVFSSAEFRLKIFKNKTIQIVAFSSSLDSLNSKNNAFVLASGSTYPFFPQETDALQSSITNIFDSFDGYESFLYRSGLYATFSGSFVSASAISDLELSAQEYDKTNRDSLINNTSEHIIIDPENDDYITFISMIGQFFDELYEYISSVPSQKQIGHTATEEFTRRIVEYMLETFGWNVGESLEQSSIVNNYLTTSEASELNSLSTEERLKSVRNRILLNLPQIYKTKGTEESVRLLLSCYGIPSTLLSIREYGGVNYSDESATNTTYERAYMYQWNTSSIHDQFSVNIPSGVRTCEFKLSIDNASDYLYGVEQTLLGAVPPSASSSPGDVSGSGQWAIGFVRERQQNTGRIFFRIGYTGNEILKIYSPKFPLFDGNIYSVMVRRNDPDIAFQFTASTDEIPTIYDLFVQRNQSGNDVINARTSSILYNVDGNVMFSDVSASLKLGGWFADRNGQGFVGTMDKVELWADPVLDSNFIDYVNSINSYSFSGSRPAYESLLFRMHTDYPFDVRSSSYWPNANPFYATSASAKQSEFLSALYPASSEYLINSNAWAGFQKIVSTACGTISQSSYPFQFKIIDYPNTILISKFGPNRFRNEKITQLDQQVSARLDSQDRSTFIPNNHVAPDSNQLGFFADPQDFKNKDIVRYFGNIDLMDAIGVPGNMFSSSYDSLKDLRRQYADSKNALSGSRTLFNELITLFKLYFNTSIFDSIKNLIPARTNAMVGILVEPTILERPKYQAKPVIGEFKTGSVLFLDTTASKYFRDPNTKMVKISEFINYAEFNVDTSSLLTGIDISTLPHNLSSEMNLSYINLPSRDLPKNYLERGTYTFDIPDQYELGHFSTNDFMPAPDGTIGRVPFDMNRVTHADISQSYFMMKRWKKYSIYAKTGPWNRTTVPSDNMYSTNSIFLYDYVLVTDDWFNTIAYTGSFIDDTPGDPGIEVVGPLWTHRKNTFKHTPNRIENNVTISVVKTAGGYVTNEPYIVNSADQYFELVSGYPRNHFTHKRDLFSLYRLQSFGKVNNQVTTGTYKRSSQTVSSTIGINGLEDGTSPVESNQVSNVNLVQGSNVISG